MTKTKTKRSPESLLHGRLYGRAKAHWPAHLMDAPRPACGPDVPDAVTPEWLAANTGVWDGCRLLLDPKWNAKHVRALMFPNARRLACALSCLAGCLNEDHLDWTGKPKSAEWLGACLTHLSEQVSEDAEGHWEWDGRLTDGDATVRYRAEYTTVLRMAWLCVKGAWPSRSLRARCGKAWCVNPEHACTTDDPAYVAERRQIKNTRARAAWVPSRPSQTPVGAPKP